MNNTKMRRSLFLPLLVVAACSKSESATPNAGTISAMTPSTAFLGRTTEVMISGAGTHFAGTPKIEFNDPAIRTPRVEVLSPTSLRVAIEITEEANAGPHDVIVTTIGLGDAKNEVVTLKGGLVATAPLKHEAAGTTVTRGGLVDFIVTNQDKDNGFGSAPVFLSGGVAAKISEITPMRLAGTVLVDPLAPIGPLKLRFSAKNARGESLSYVAASEDPAAPKVTEAPATLQLTPGKVEGNEAIRAPHGSNLYKAAIPTENSVFFLSMATVGAQLKSTSGARLVGAMAPPSGRFGDGVTFETTYDNVAAGRAAVGLARSAGDAFFAVYSSDLSGGPADYNYSIKLGVAKATLFNMKEPSPVDGPSNPVATIELLENSPAYAVDGAIDSRDDADYVIFTPAKAGRIFVAALPVESAVPLNVAVFGNDPGVANCSAFVAGGLGTKQAEIRATAGTPYCARVNTTTPMTTKYTLVISPELP